MGNRSSAPHRSSEPLAPSEGEVAIARLKHIMQRDNGQAIGELVSAAVATVTGPVEEPSRAQVALAQRLLADLMNETFGKVEAK